MLFRAVVASLATLGLLLCSEASCEEPSIPGSEPSSQTPPGNIASGSDGRTPQNFSSTGKVANGAPENDAMSGRSDYFTGDPATQLPAGPILPAQSFLGHTNHGYESPGSLTIQEICLSGGVLLYSLILFGMFAHMKVKGARLDLQSFKIMATLLLVTAALFIMTASYTEKQAAPIFGLLGTLAGYILSRTANEQPRRKQGRRKKRVEGDARKGSLSTSQAEQPADLEQGGEPPTASSTKSNADKTA